MHTFTYDDWDNNTQWNRFSHNYKHFEPHVDPELFDIHSNGTECADLFLNQSADSLVPVTTGVPSGLFAPLMPSVNILHARGDLQKKKDFHLVTSKAIAESINQNAESWEADESPRFKGMTTAEFKQQLLQSTNQFSR